jgi:DNA-binding NtrC family response regulator
VFPIEIPALRDRGEDVVLLARDFAAQLGKELRGREATLSEASLQALRSHQWPGNVRELENAIERACILTDTMLLEPKDLGLLAQGSDETEALPSLDLGGTLFDVTQRAVRSVERRKILAALAANENNKSRTAEDLGVSYKTLRTNLKEYDL